MALNSPAFLIASLTLASICIYKYLLYPALLSPLSRIPNAHPTAPISSLWITWQRLHQHESRAIHAAHLAHGPIVRVGPRELSINDLDSLRTVYAGGFEKGPWYAFFDNYGLADSNTFATLRSKAHSARKRMLANIYAKSTLQASPHLAAVMAEVVQGRLVPLVQDAAAAGASVEVLELWYAVMMDVVSGYLFGLAVSTNFVQDAAVRRWWIALFQSRRPYDFWEQEVPWVTRWLGRVGVRMVPAWVGEANREIEAWGLRMCDRAEESVRAGGVSAVGREPLVYAQLRTAMARQAMKAGEGSGSEERRLQIASELLCHIGAGHETSGITLTYLTWQLSRHPQIQAQLRAELRTLPSAPTPKALDALPLLHACVLETLRLHAAIPGPQPRLTPFSPLCSLGPYRNIPGNVRVSAQAYSLHRNDVVFPEPLAWRPARWLEVEEAQGDRKQRWLWAFGSGGRMCVGSNLAMQQIKGVVAAVWRGFETEVVGGEGMEQRDGYTVGPVGGRLDVRFRAVG
ncbi:MAG: hypothetical protein M1829_003312 [Trizodia sp. TS-e1964]|nr:MAG: hypothetical protein M1829_003312 [Trizodia sp. TS-e1964]